MAETPNHSDQAQRIRALQERRAASSRQRSTSSGTRRSAPATGATRPRRRHPAAGTRIFLAGLSVSSFFAVAGAIGLAHRSAPSTQTVSASNPAGTVSSGGAAATPGTTSATVVNTVTKGS